MGGGGGPLTTELAETEVPGLGGRTEWAENRLSERERAGDKEWDWLCGR
jgi:hypothetical protein